MVNKARQLIPASAVPGNADPPLLGDHVPCLMDKDELYSLRGIGTSKDQLEAAALQAAATACQPGDNGCTSYASEVMSKPLTGSVAQKRAQLTLWAQTWLKQPEAQQKVVAAVDAAAAAQTFNRPTDLGCSMSIMPWKEASKVFGRAVANTFLAVQIVVRNMDPDHEYLLHDAELAVDAYSSAIQRFQAGHEKEVVRGVSVWGQSYGRQAIAAHIVEGVGILMGAVVGMSQGIPANFVDATGAYQAGLVPTFNKLFPDLNTNNLNNLNDLGFSARSNSRIVVPKGGAVPFVLFVPVQPLQEACWLQAPRLQLF